MDTHSVTYNIASHTIYIRPPYVNSTATSNNVGPRLYESKLERELRESIERLGELAIVTKMRRREANRKAMSDARSRQRVSPARGRAPKGARLQTYEGAMFARMAPKKYGG